MVRHDQALDGKVVHYQGTKESFVFEGPSPKVCVRSRPRSVSMRQGLLKLCVPVKPE